MGSCCGKGAAPLGFEVVLPSGERREVKSMAEVRILREQNPAAPGQPALTFKAIQRPK